MGHVSAVMCFCALGSVGGGCSTQVPSGWTGKRSCSMMFQICLCSTKPALADRCRHLKFLPLTTLPPTSTCSYSSLQLDVTSRYKPLHDACGWRPQFNSGWGKIKFRSRDCRSAPVQAQFQHAETQFRDGRRVAK